MQGFWCQEFGSVLHLLFLIPVYYWCFSTLDGHWFIHLPRMKRLAPPNWWQRLYLRAYYSLLIMGWARCMKRWFELGGAFKHATVRLMLSSINCHENWLLVPCLAKSMRVVCIKGPINSLAICKSPASFLYYVYQSGFSREHHRIYMYIRKIYFKKLPHWIVGSEKSKTSRASQQVGNSGKELMLQSGNRTSSSLRNLSFSFKNFQVFGWMRPHPH